MWVLGTEVEFCPRAVYSLNCWTISPNPRFTFKLRFYAGSLSKILERQWTEAVLLFVCTHPEVSSDSWGPESLLVLHAQWLHTMSGKTAPESSHVCIWTDLNNWGRTDWVEKTTWGSLEQGEPHIPWSPWKLVLSSLFASFPPNTDKMF